MRAPDRFGTEPILAWRCWRVDLLDGLLLPTHFTEAYIWPPAAEMVARCESSHILVEHETPSVGSCTCGVWVYRDPDRALDRFWQACHLKPLVHNSIPAWGSVNVWGRIVEHEFGYRVSRAYPYEVTVPEELSDEVYREHGAVLLGKRRTLADYDPHALARKLRANYLVDVSVG